MPSHTPSDPHHSPSRREWMRKIMQSSMSELQKKRNTSSSSIGKLQDFVRFMTDKKYLDAFVQGVEERGVGDGKSAELMVGEIGRNGGYSQLILDDDEAGPIDPIMYKLRQSPFEKSLYFQCFHDLQSLTEILADPLPQTIQNSLIKIRRFTLNEPQRETVRTQAFDAIRQWSKQHEHYLDNSRQRSKIDENDERKNVWRIWKSFLLDDRLEESERSKVLFGELPCRSEAMTAEEFQECVYDVDDLGVVWGGEDREGEDGEDEEQEENQGLNSSLDEDLDSEQEREGDLNEEEEQLSQEQWSEQERERQQDGQNEQDEQDEQNITTPSKQRTHQNQPLNPTNPPSSQPPHQQPTTTNQPHPLSTHRSLPIYTSHPINTPYNNTFLSNSFKKLQELQDMFGVKGGW